MKAKKQLTTYVITVFVLTWAFMFGVIWPAYKKDPNSYALLAAACMFFPTVSMLLTRLITKEGFRDMLLRPRFKGSGKAYLMAYFGPTVLMALGAALYFLIFPGKLDLNFGYFKSLMEASGVPYEAQAVPAEGLVALQLAQAVLLAGAVNLIPALGEEWGWRGYMMPRLLEITTPGKALLTGGVIWGLWHAPLIALGHNYGTDYPGAPWGGIACMCLFCAAMGVLLTWLTEKTGSVIPAAVCHGAVNGVFGFGIYLTADGGSPFIGPAPTGFIGGAPLLIAAAIVSLRMMRRKKEAE